MGRMPLTNTPVWGCRLHRGETIENSVAESRLSAPNQPRWADSHARDPALSPLRHEIHFLALPDDSTEAIRRSSEYCSRAWPVPYALRSSVPHNLAKYTPKHLLLTPPIPGVLRMRAPAVARLCIFDPALLFSDQALHELGPLLLAGVGRLGIAAISQTCVVVLCSSSAIR
jgi:hypothetical protein